MVNPLTELLSRPRTRPISQLSRQLQEYAEARPDPYEPRGFDFTRPEKQRPDFSQEIELSRVGTRVVQQQALNTAIQRHEAEMARLQELARQPIDLSGVTPRFSGSSLSAEQQRGNLFAGRTPLSSYRVTSEYGPRNSQSGRISSNHGGIDLAAPAGTPIYATHDGVVSVAGWAGGYGNAVYIDSGGGLQTRYGHQSRVNVRSGQRVKRGQLIGYVGSTGRSTGNHLHYEIRINGRSVNPRGYLNF